MSIFNQLKTIFSQSIQCIPVRKEIIQIDGKTLPLIVVQAQKSNIVFKNFLVNSKENKNVEIYYRSGFVLQHDNILSLLIIYEQQKIFINFSLNEINCCSIVLGMFLHRKVVIENADEPTDGLFNLPIDEAVDRFSFEFEDKLKPILFKQFYSASVKDSVFKTNEEIYNIKHNNPKLYNDIISIFENKYKNGPP